jgi:hypothetical protein
MQIVFNPNLQVVHEAGSMIIVFPHAYHAGFNHGLVAQTF